MTTDPDPGGLPIWTVYRPITTDHPGQWVARLSYVDGETMCPTATIILSETLEGVRAVLPPGLFRESPD